MSKWKNIFLKVATAQVRVTSLAPVQVCLRLLVSCMQLHICRCVCVCVDIHDMTFINLWLDCRGPVPQTQKSVINSVSESLHFYQANVLYTCSAEQAYTVTNESTHHLKGISPFKKTSSHSPVLLKYILLTHHSSSHLTVHAPALGKGVHPRSD